MRQLVRWAIIAAVVAVLIAVSPILLVAVALIMLVAACKATICWAMGDELVWTKEYVAACKEDGVSLYPRSWDR